MIFLFPRRGGRVGKALTYKAGAGSSTFLDLGAGAAQHPHPWRVVAMNRYAGFAVACSAAFAATPASALCMYNGILYYETTLQEEFVDAPIVVKAKVLSERDDKMDDPKLKRDWGTHYRLRVEQVFKGKPARILEDFTERNSGAFYLDVGKEYLLFLDKASKDEHLAPGAMMANYSCGQSREWKDVSAREQLQLHNLAVNDELEPGKLSGQ